MASFNLKEFFEITSDMSTKARDISVADLQACRDKLFTGGNLLRIDLDPSIFCQSFDRFMEELVNRGKISDFYTGFTYDKVEKALDHPSNTLYNNDSVKGKILKTIIVNCNNSVFRRNLLNSSTIKDDVKVEMFKEVFKNEKLSMDVVRIELLENPSFMSKMNRYKKELLPFVSKFLLKLSDPVDLLNGYIRSDDDLKIVYDLNWEDNKDLINTCFQKLEDDKVSKLVEKLSNDVNPYAKFKIMSDENKLKVINKADDKLKNALVPVLSTKEKGQIISEHAKKLGGVSNAIHVAKGEQSKLKTINDKIRDTRKDKRKTYGEYTVNRIKVASTKLRIMVNRLASHVPTMGDRIGFLSTYKLKKLEQIENDYEKLDMLDTKRDEILERRNLDKDVIKEERKNLKEQRKEVRERIKDIRKARVKRKQERNPADIISKLSKPPLADRTMRAGAIAAMMTPDNKKLFDQAWRIVLSNDDFNLNDPSKIAGIVTSNRGSLDRMIDGGISADLFRQLLTAMQAKSLELQELGVHSKEEVVATLGLRRGSSTSLMIVFAILAVIATLIYAAITLLG